MSFSTFAQTTPPIENGVSNKLAEWRAANYSDVRYKLNLTIEKKAPTLKGSIEVNVKLKTENGKLNPIILDWRKIKGHEELSKISNVYVNGMFAMQNPPANAVGSDKIAKFEELNEHLIFKENIKTGENIIKLDFESPILTSGGAITRYIDKEDGAEYIYSLFVPSDASTVFPVFDQPDLKARFELGVDAPRGWNVVSNTIAIRVRKCAMAKLYFWFEETKPISTYVFAFAAGEFEEFSEGRNPTVMEGEKVAKGRNSTVMEGAGKGRNSKNSKKTRKTKKEIAENYKSANVADSKNSRTIEKSTPSITVGFPPPKIYVRKSQAGKFKPHAEEVFRLNRESIKYLEDYFDYKFPFPKYDLVLIPEFPFGGMEHAGATFLRESSVIFPTEPTANNYISRANLIFHENAHQWFGDTVTMKWFDDLWLKEGFATFMAYKAMEKVLPQYNAWKVFYERTKPLAYQTDVTRGTTPIYQEIPNLNSAKSAYGNIVYQKAPGFLKQAEFYLGEKEFQTAVRSFLKKHEFANAEWSDLVDEFETASKMNLDEWASIWVKKRGLPIITVGQTNLHKTNLEGKNSDAAVILGLNQDDALGEDGVWQMRIRVLVKLENGQTEEREVMLNRKRMDGKMGFATYWTIIGSDPKFRPQIPQFVFPNYQDYGYGIFLLDERSKRYILENIQNEKDDFLRSMMWGSLWDSTRFAELDPKDYVELAIKNIGVEEDVSTISSILARVDTAFTYYLSDAQKKEIAPKLENLLIDKMQTAKTEGERITFYRAFLGIASSDNAKEVLKDLLKGRNPTVMEGAGKGRNPTVMEGAAKGRNPTVMEGAGKGRNPTVMEGAKDANLKNSEKTRKTKKEIADIYKNSTSSEKNAPFLTVGFLPLRTKDKFDIVTRLVILGDKDAPKLLAELEETETDDAAKRYAYAAKAGFATKENKAKYWNDFVNNKELSENWIEEAVEVWNSLGHSKLTLPYLEKALTELPNLKQNRKIFFVNSWLASLIGGQKSVEALNIVNKFLKDNPKLDIDLQRKILERLDGLERAVNIREKYGK